MQSSSVRSGSISSPKSHTLKTAIKLKLFDNFHYFVENPKAADLDALDKSDKFSFKFDNKSFGAYVDSPNREYYTNFYKTFGTPHIFGIYYVDKANNLDSIIGAVTLVLRYDNKIWQIIDLKIKKEYRGQNYLDKLITSTFTTRIMKSSAYYTISMNPNSRIDAICNNMKLPKMKNRGKMYIFIISFENIKKIIPTLETFYCSEIGFIDNSNLRIFIDNNTKKTIKMLHLHHNSNYREFDYREPKKGYQYCFSIHEDNDFIISTLKNNFSINHSASANVFSNDFKSDWSKFVKTFEI
jgi:hypothetical protein